MYDVKSITLDEADLMEQLLPKLRHRVFHVTTGEAWPCIEASGRILASPPESVPRCDNAGLRHIGHVSLCDLRAVEEGDLQHALEKYYFLDYRTESRGPVFMFLTRSAIEDLVPYQELRDRINSLKKLIVPFVEASHAGDLPLEKIGEVLAVEVVRSPTPAHPAEL